MKLVLGATDGITQEILDSDDPDTDRPSGFALVCSDATPDDAQEIVHRFNSYIELAETMYGFLAYVEDENVLEIRPCGFVDELRSLVSKLRLEYLRGELRAERISYEELHELQTLIPFIEDGDVELLEAAGVPEHKDS